MKRILVALLISAVTLLSACNQITQGEVYDKEYIPAHNETYSVTQTIQVGDQTIHIPQTETRFVPDEYLIYIRKENDKGNFDKAVYSVGRERYDSINIGDEVSFE